MLKGILSSRKLMFRSVGPLGVSAPTLAGILIIVALAVVAIYLYRRR